MDDIIFFTVLALVAAVVLGAAWNGMHDDYDSHGV